MLTFLDTAWIVFIILFPMIFLYFIVRFLMRVFESLQFSFIESLIIVGVSVFFTIQPLINSVDLGIISLFSINNWNVGIHLVGFILPLFVCFSIIKKKIIQPSFFIGGVMSISLISFLVTQVVPEQGIVSPFPLWFLPAIFASAGSLLMFRDSDKIKQTAFAYCTGVLGVFIGADIFHLSELLNYSSSTSMQAVIGGAAAWDLIFITGIIAVLLNQLYHYILSQIEYIPTSVDTSVPS